MALDNASFIARFPEFSDIDEGAPDAITNAIADAKPFVSQKIWGSRYEAGVMYKAAHLLAFSPLGEDARLKGSEAQSTYGVVFDEMKKSLPIRMLVSGGC